MERIHFVHTSDWHLGFYQYNKPERFQDYYNAAQNVVDQILRIQPQFVLHTGDVFHHSRPAPGTIRQAVRVLKKLDRAKIPTYLVRGNHDGRDAAVLQRGGGVIALLKDLKLVHYVDDTVVSILDDTASIVGVGYYPGGGTPRKINEVLQEHSDALEDRQFKILALHGYVEGQLEEYDQIPIRHIAKLGFNYVGAGHHHIPWTRPEHFLYSPGSTEATSVSDWRRDDRIDGITTYSSFFEIEAELTDNGWGDVKVTEHKVLVRPKIMIKHFSTKTSVTEVEKEIDQLIAEKLTKVKEIEPKVAEQKPLLELVIDSILSFDELNSIQFSDDNRFLHVLISLDGKQEMVDFTETRFEEMRIEEMIKEQIDFDGPQADKFTELSLQLLDELGEKPTHRDLGDDEFDGIVTSLHEYHTQDEDS